MGPTHGDSTGHRAPPQTALDNSPRGLAAYRPMHVHPLSYDAARYRIRNGDLLLWRPTSWMGRLIARGTGSPYSHAAMAGWFGDVLLQFEFLQAHGGRAVTLSSQIGRWPAACDVYRVAHLHGRKAVEAIARRTGQPYGWLDFARITLARLGRIAAPWWPTATDDPPLERPLVCSAAVADAIRRGDVYIRAGEPAWSITPGDLAQEADYQFTIAGLTYADAPPHLFGT